MKNNSTTKDRIDNVQALVSAGLEQHNAFRSHDAEKLYTLAIGLSPDNASALFLRGILFLQTARRDAGIRDLRAALRLDPANPSILYNLGLALKAQGDRNNAIAHLTDALRVKPDYHQASYALGSLFHDNGRLDEAITRYNEALRIKPDWPEVLNNLGAALQAQGKLDDADSRYTEALRLKPDYAEAAHNLGLVRQHQGRLDEAIARYGEALRLKPNYPEALNNLGLALAAQGQADAAIARFTEALTFAPNYPHALINLGNALQNQGRLDEAITRYKDALRIMPNQPEALNNLGTALRAQGKLKEAIAHFAEAQRISPNYADAHFNEGLARLLAGEFKEGWGKYQWRWRAKTIRPHGHRQPLWDGSRLNDKTILLHCEQGLGDSIQFIRYAKLVKAKGGTVVVLCPKPLARLFRGVKGIDHLVTGPTDIPRCDVQSPLLSLPMIFDTIPADIPYLYPEPDLIAAWRTRLESLDGFRIGVVWQGNPDAKIDRGRSFRLELLAPLAAIKGVRLISLQRRDGLDQLLTLPDGMSVTTLTEDVDAGDDAFIDTAAIMANLDLIISSDTSVAHLAGALGRPVWVLLQKVPDWRWLLDREDCPWHPTMRLFRQPSAGDWRAVVATVFECLRKVVAVTSGEELGR